MKAACGPAAVAAAHPRGSGTTACDRRREVLPGSVWERVTEVSAPGHVRTDKPQAQGQRHRLPCSPGVHRAPQGSPLGFGSVWELAPQLSMSPGDLLVPGGLDQNRASSTPSREVSPGDPMVSARSPVPTRRCRHRDSGGKSASPPLLREFAGSGSG